MRRLLPIGAVFLAACSGESDGASDNAGGAAAANGGGVSATGGTATGGSGAGGAPAGGVGNSTAAGAAAGTDSGGTSNGASAGSGSGGAAAGGTGNGATAGVGGGSSCASPTVRITELDVGTTVVANEDEVALKPVSLAPIGGGGARVGFMGADGKLHIVRLGADDQPVAGAAHTTLDAVDFQDILADEAGGVALLTRAARAGGTLNCGNPANLCGTAPNPAVPCREMVMVRFDGTQESWATPLTDSDAARPPYLTSKADNNATTFIWWYAHHGRLATDGTRYGAFYGAAISVSEGGCVNIHQGDQHRVVDAAGKITGGFGWGCSHSGYERIVWDSGAKKFSTVCKNDAPTGGKSGRIAIAPATTTVLPVDLWYSALSDLAVAPGGGYWLAASDRQAGQTPNANGFAEAFLIRYSTGAPNLTVSLASTAGTNARAPHLAPLGSQHLLVGWETSTAAGELAANDANRKLWMQVRKASDGSQVSSPQEVAVRGNRYQEFVSFPDGSAAYATRGSSATKLAIARIMPCQ